MANLVELFDNIVQMQNLNGVPLAYGKMYVYALGRTRLMDTWSDVDGSSLNTNPIILDNAGQCHCYVSDAFDYTIVVCDAYNNEIFSLDKYLYSEGSHSHADVAVAPSESIAVSSYHVGETTVYVPYLTGDLGKVYTGIDPVNVDNVNDTISVSHVGLGLQDPLYFVEDSETACIIGCSAQTEIPSATSGKWEDAADTVIANSAQWGEDTTYEAGSYVDITDNTISVTGLQPSGDYADSTALDTKLDTTAFSDVSGSFLQSADLEGYATESFVNSAVDSAVSGKLDSATYAAQSGDFYLTSNPDGYITGVPSSYLQNSDLTIVDNKITEISGIELSAGDEFPQSATEAIEVVTANSGDWNDVTAKLDKTDSGNFYPMEGNPSGFLTTETDWTDTITAASSYAYEQATAAIPTGLATTGDLQAVSGEITGLIPTDLFTKASADTLYQPIGNYQTAGDYLTTSDSANFYTTANESGFATTAQLQAVSGDITGLIPTDLFTKASADTLYYPLEGNPSGFITTETDWTDTITAASANAYELATAQIPTGIATTGDLQAVSGEITAMIPTDLFTKASADTLYQPIGNYQTAGDYLTTADSAEFYTTGNPSGFLTEHQSLPESANWNSTYNTVHDNSASWTGAGSVEYMGIDPIVVNNTVHQISANTWALAIGDGLSAVEDDVNRQTIISVTGSISVETGSI